MIYREQGRNREAAAQFRTLLILNPAHKEARLMLPLVDPNARR